MTVRSLDWNKGETLLDRGKNRGTTCSIEIFVKKAYDWNL